MKNKIYRDADCFDCKFINRANIFFFRFINLFLFALFFYVFTTAQSSKGNSVTVFGGASFPLNIDTYKNKPGFITGIEFEIKNNHNETALNASISYIQFKYNQFNNLGNLILVKGGLRKYWLKNFYVEGNVGLTLFGSGFFLIPGLKTGYNFSLSKHSSLNFFSHYDLVLSFDGGELVHFISPGLGYRVNFR